MVHPSDQAEECFRISKSDLSLRPVFHQKAERVEAHVLVCFLTLAMWRTLEMWMKGKGLGNCFVVLQGSLFDLAKGEGATTEHAGRLGISLNAAKVALSRLRQRYRELLRLEVSRLVEDSAAVDEEIAHLVRVLGR